MTAFSHQFFGRIYTRYFLILFLETTVMIERESFPDPYYLRTLSVYSLDIQT
jgi:hypothetical protein